MSYEWGFDNNGTIYPKLNKGINFKFYDFLDNKFEVDALIINPSYWNQAGFPTGCYAYIYLKHNSTDELDNIPKSFTTDIYDDSLGPMTTMVTWYNLDGTFYYYTNRIITFNIEDSKKANQEGFQHWYFYNFTY